MPGKGGRGFKLRSPTAGLSSVEDTESILAKAIRDGGIEAFIDHQNGWMASRDRVDVYSTGEPQSAFHARVAFCLDIHNEVRSPLFATLSITEQAPVPFRYLKRPDTSPHRPARSSPLDHVRSTVPEAPVSYGSHSSTRVVQGKPCWGIAFLVHGSDEQPCAVSQSMRC